MRGLTDVLYIWAVVISISFVYLLDMYIFNHVYLTNAKHWTQEIPKYDYDFSGQANYVTRSGHELWRWRWGRRCDAKKIGPCQLQSDVKAVLVFKGTLC